MFHDWDGTARKILMDFFDSSLILAKESDTAIVRDMTRAREYQKYTTRKAVGSGLRKCKTQSKTEFRVLMIKNS